MNHFFWVITDVADQSRTVNVGCGLFELALKDKAHELTPRKRLEIASTLPHHLRILDRDDKVIARGKCADSWQMSMPPMPPMTPLVYCAVFVDPTAHRVEYRAKADDLKPLASAKLEDIGQQS